MQVEELKGRVKSHREGLENAFDPLREQIEKLKANFWEKNRKSIEATAMEYIKRTVKERVATEVSNVVSGPLVSGSFLQFVMTG